MMQLEILSVGRLKQQAEQKLQSRYIERINKSAMAVGIKSITVEELTEARHQTPEARKSDEATRLLNRAAASTLLIALDENGKQFNSREFADFLSTNAREGQQMMSFALGGPDGHGKELLSKAHKRISLSKMTLPHGLARICLIEQIYRATTILSGHPYHRD